MIKNILWNFDGILFDTSPARTLALSKTMYELGYPLPMNLIGSLICRSYEDFIDSLNKRYQFSMDEFHKTFHQHYSAIPLWNQPLFPGVIEVCEWICKHGGVNCIVTKRDLKTCLQFLYAYQINWCFSTIQTFQNNDHNSFSKALCDLMRQNRLDSQVTLLISNREKDIQSGRAAGAKACFFGYPEGLSQADWQVEHYHQLLTLLREGTDGGD